MNGRNFDVIVMELAIFNKNGAWHAAFCYVPMSKVFPNQLFEQKHNRDQHLNESLG